MSIRNASKPETKTSVERPKTFDGRYPLDSPIYVYFESYRRNQQSASDAHADRRSDTQPPWMSISTVIDGPCQEPPIKMSLTCYSCSNFERRCLQDATALLWAVLAFLLSWTSNSRFWTGCRIVQLFRLWVIWITCSCHTLFSRKCRIAPSFCLYIFAIFPAEKATHCKSMNIINVIFTSFTKNKKHLIPSYSIMVPKKLKDPYTKHASYLYAGKVNRSCNIEFIERNTSD